jgi:peptide/nickel transport system substrate-binding protein
MFTRTIFALLCALALGFAAAFGPPIHAAEDARYESVLRVGHDAEPESIDARFMGIGATSMNTWCYDSLVTFGKQGVKDVVPMLAESWKQIDNVTWLVKIRKGVYFHGGKELTAEHVKANYDWKISTPQGWRPVRGLEYVEPIVKEIQLVDKSALRFTLKKPFGAFVPIILGLGSLTGIIDPTVAEKAAGQSATKPEGTGPFKLVEWRRGEQLVFERNENYWLKRPHVKRLIVRIIPDVETRLIALQRGDLDAARVEAVSKPIVDADPKLKFLPEYVPWRGNGLWFNMRRWPMSDRRFRLAVAMGAEWRQVAKNSIELGLGRPILTLLDDSWAYDSKAADLFPSHDVKKARELIASLEKESGKKIGSIQVYTDERRPGVAALEMAKTQLRQVGIDLVINVESRTRVQARTYRDPRVDYDMLRRGLDGAAIDPSMRMLEFYSQSQGAGDGKNSAGYENPKLDKLSEQALIVADQKQRKELYKKAQVMILQDLPVIPLEEKVDFWAVTKKVQDYHRNGSGWTYLVSPWNNVWIDR